MYKKESIYLLDSNTKTRVKPFFNILKTDKHTKLTQSLIYLRFDDQK